MADERPRERARHHAGGRSRASRESHSLLQYRAVLEAESQEIDACGAFVAVVVAACPRGGVRARFPFIVHQERALAAEDVQNGKLDSAAAWERVDPGDPLIECHHPAAEDVEQIEAEPKPLQR